MLGCPQNAGKMMKKKKILLLATGGTIASSGADGLKPAVTVGGILSKIPQITSEYCIDSVDLMSLDSTNVQHEDWTVIAGAIDKNRLSYDGAVITHGTDTLAYTASALSFMLLGINIPVVLTGSQLPIEADKTDAYANLSLAFKTASAGYPGVFVSFGGKVMLGSRAHKAHTTELCAFDSVNFPPVAELENGVLKINRKLIPKAGAYKFSEKMDADVFLVKLTPGTNPEIFDALLNTGCRGFIIEGFGLGGVHSERRSIVKKLAELAERKIPVVLKSQCEGGESRLDVYEVGIKAEKAGAVCAYDMTTESAFAKLKYLISNGVPYEKIKSGFQTDMTGEIRQGEVL